MPDSGSLDRASRFSRVANCIAGTPAAYLLGARCRDEWASTGDGDHSRVRVYFPIGFQVADARRFNLMSARVQSGESNDLFEALIATAVDGIIVIDGKGIVKIYNAACERLFQYSANEVVGQNVHMLMPSPYRDEHDAYIDRYQKTRERRIIGIGREVVGRRKDGSNFPMYLSVGEGMLAGRRIFIGIIHDLTQIKAEAELRESDRRYFAAIVQSSREAIISATLDGVVTSWNEAAEQTFGYSAGEMIGENISRIIPEEWMAQESETMERVRAGERHIVETIRRRKDGAEIFVSLSVSPIYGANGEIIGAAKISRDVTAQKKAEARLRDLQSELLHVTRLTSMGQLSSALAHELNQPLTAVMNYINAARRTLSSSTEPESGRANGILEKAAAQTQRAGQIIRRLRDFVEKREPNRAPEEINKIVADSIALGMVGTADANVKLITDLSAGLPQVFVDRVQIQQVLINLMRNAAEAMQDCQKRELRVQTRRASDAFVQVSVIDSGPGIPPEVAERLFQPFVSTKAKGMGVGLTICRSIVEAHSGRLWMTPSEEGGTMFQFQLPTVDYGEQNNDA